MSTDFQRTEQTLRYYLMGLYGLEEGFDEMLTYEIDYSE